MLRPLGIEPVLETREIDSHTFRADPSASNRVWVHDRPMEEWLHGAVGASPCCSVRGRRTVEVAGTTFETIPERLLIRAALVAAAQLLA